MIRLHDEVESERNALQQGLDTERAERSATAGKLAASQAEAKAAVARADDLQWREAALQDQLKEVRDELRQARTATALDQPPPPRSGE